MFLLILLGMLSAFGPFVTDMYLPSLPAMADYFSTHSSMVQLGLTTSMIGLALGQIFFGPLSDKYGRRPLLLVSMILFIVSTVFCLFAPDILFVYHIEVDTGNRRGRRYCHIPFGGYGQVFGEGTGQDAGRDRRD